MYFVFYRLYPSHHGSVWLLPVIPLVLTLAATSSLLEKGFRQGVVKVYFPLTSDMTWQTQRLQNRAKKRVITQSSSSWWFIQQSQLSIHTNTGNHDEYDQRIRRTRFRGTCKQALWHYITSYIQCSWCDITGPRNNAQFTPLFFCFISFQKPTECCQIYLPQNPAKLMCRKGLPKWLAGMICQNNLPNSSATPARRFYLLELSAIPAHGIDLPEEPPSPLRVPRQDLARHFTPPPPPHRSV